MTETTYSDAGQNNSAAYINTDATALEIIIDIPWHNLGFLIQYMRF
jgi:hypothetical protein